MNDQTFWFSIWSVIMSALVIISLASIPSCHREEMRKFDLFQDCIRNHQPLECSAALGGKK